MTTNSEPNNTPNSQTTRHQKSAGISRRQMMAVGGAGLAGLAAVATGDRADANTQKPIASATGSANPNGRFANKVILITGATSGIFALRIIELSRQLTFQATNIQRMPSSGAFTR
jgi:hypothetical protein